LMIEFRQHGSMLYQKGRVRIKIVLGQRARVIPVWGWERADPGATKKKRLRITCE
jgi:hypothetical protein